MCMTDLQLNLLCFARTDVSCFRFQTKSNKGSRRKQPYLVEILPLALSHTKPRSRGIDVKFPLRRTNRHPVK